LENNTGTLIYQGYFGRCFPGFSTIILPLKERSDNKKGLDFKAVKP
jgi:hypothetical protein